MAQKASSPEPGKNFDTRGIGTQATVNKAMRKTGYRPDAQMQTNQNSLDPDALVRTATDPRLA